MSDGDATASYTVTVRESFIAQHTLTVPNPGPEGERHSHRFDAVVTFGGDSLNEFGYLIDIDHARSLLDAVVDSYRDRTLNNHLDGNPSCERLAKSIHEQITVALDAPMVETVDVTIHEDDTAVVSYIDDV